MHIVDVMDYIDGQAKYYMKMIHFEILIKLEGTWNTLHQMRMCIEKKFSRIKFWYM
jgi:hypothetical protein